MRDSFRRWLDRHGCYVFTINGFPMRRFHGTRVKEKVYAPDWTTVKRLDIACRLFDRWRSGLRSMPAWYRQREYGARDRSKVFRSPEPAGREGAGRCDVRQTSSLAGEHAARLSDRTGHAFGCVGFGTGAGWSVREHGGDAGIFRKAGNRSAHRGMFRHLPFRGGVRGNPDGAGSNGGSRDCHGQAAPQFGVASTTHAGGSRPARGVSGSGVPPSDLARGGATGKLTRWLDLDAALAETEADGADVSDDEWRIHFHVPLHAAPALPLATKMTDGLGALDWLASNPGLCQHVEMETYTWEVSPSEWQAAHVEDNWPGNTTGPLTGCANAASGHDSRGEPSAAGAGGRKRRAPLQRRLASGGGSRSWFTDCYWQDDARAAEEVYSRLQGRCTAAALEGSN